MNRPLKSLGIGLLAFFSLVSTSHAERPVFPDLIPLPDGFRPEGIVQGIGPELFAGSLAEGAIYRVDARTGALDPLVPPEPGRITVGLAYDPRSDYIFAARGPSGQASIYSAEDGALLADYALTASGTFINDVIVTRDAAYFTDSFAPVLYRVPLSAGGMLANGGNAEAIPLSGDFEVTPGFNANGIEGTADGKWLVIVHSGNGVLYRVNPSTGEATAIDLGGVPLPNGDGLLLRGRTLYVVQNFLNQVAVVDLAPDLMSGEVVETLTAPDFDIPSTVADFGNALYLVNARFTTTPTPDTEYDIVRISK